MDNESEVGMNKLLITGITGRSGRYLGKLLIANNINAIAIIRDSNKFLQVFKEQDVLEYELCDIRNTEAVEKVIRHNEITTLFHIAGIGYSSAVVKAAVSSQCVNRIILVHTTGIYSRYKAASANYLRIEDEIIQLLKGTNIDLTILRPTMIYGSLDDVNISKFIKMVDVLRLFPLVDGGEFELQPVNYQDLGMAYYQVLTNEESTCNKNYTLSGGTVIYLKDILSDISNFLGKRTIFFPVPFWLAYLVASVIYYLSFKHFDYREKVQRLVEPRAYDHSEAEKDFGYSPMEFREGLKDEVEMYKKAKKTRAKME